MKLAATYKTLLYAAIVMLSTISIVMSLVFFSGELKHPSNGFSRIFYKPPARQIQTMELDKPIRNIIGISDNAVYFDTPDPALMYASNDLQTLRAIHLPVKKTEALSSFFITAIDSPAVYIAAGNIPVIIMLHLNTNAVDYIHVPEKTFSICTQISPNSFVFRMYKNISGRWNQVFVKNNLLNNTSIVERNISEKNGDAGMSTDGLLQYDKVSNKLMYVHYYDNKIVCMDTNLNLLYTMHTIDTNSSYSIRIAKQNTGLVSEYTNTSPIRNINLQSCVEDGRLFISSGIKADNENQKQFDNNTVVDVYAINDKIYKGSFYIPAYKNEKPRMFNVYKNRLYVLYTNRLVLYLVTL